MTTTEEISAAQVEEWRRREEERKGQEVVFDFLPVEEPQPAATDEADRPRQAGELVRHFAERLHCVGLLVADAEKEYKGLAVELNDIMLRYTSLLARVQKLEKDQLSREEAVAVQNVFDRVETQEIASEVAGDIGRQKLEEDEANTEANEEAAKEWAAEQWLRLKAEEEAEMQKRGDEATAGVLAACDAVERKGGAE